MRSLLRIVATISGAALLALIAPHSNPWTMSRLPIHGSVISLDLAGRLVQVPLWLPLALAAAVAVLPWLTVLWRSKSGSGAFLSGADRFVFAGCLTLLAFSLIPVAARGRGAVAGLLLGTAGVVLVTYGVASPAAAARFEAWGRRLTDRLGALPAAALVPAVLVAVLVVASLGSYFVLGQIPHIVDSAAQMFHARMFAAGTLQAPPPQPETAFRFTHMILGDRWYSQYPPGHSLLLALGLLIHVPWLIAPLCGGLSVALFYLIGREAFDETTGRFSALLGAISPFVLLMSSSFMSHATILPFLCLFLFGFVRTMKRGHAWPAVLAGFSAGYALNIRPLTAVAFAAPFALYAGAELVRRLGRTNDERDAFRLARNCVLATVAFAVPLGALLAFNNLTNGDPFLFGYEALHGKQALPGFGKSGWWGVPHTPWRGLLATLNNLNAMNQYLFGLPFPSLALPLLGLAAVRRTRWDWLLAGSVATLVTAHFFYWYQDLTYGPRFLYAAVAPLILLTARSLTALPRLLDRLFPERQLLGSAGIALALALVYGWTVNVPQLAGFYSRNYYGANPSVPRAVAHAGLTRAVAFVPNHYYSSVFPDNAPMLDGDVVFARDLGPERNRETANRFPTRRFYRLRSYDDYRLVPYDPVGDTGVVTYAVETGTPLGLELLSFQLSHLANGSAREYWTGELGRGFRNHDQLWLSSDAPGLEAGILLDATRAETRSLDLWLMRSPDSGLLEIRVNGSVLLSDRDLYAHRIGVERIRLEEVPLRAGRNGLLFRIVGKNRDSSGYGLGLDYLRLGVSDLDRGR